MANRLPADAYAFYLGLGANRSYEAVAKQFGVTKAAVGHRAKRDDWATKIQEVERKAKETSEAKALESLDEMNGRHLRIARVIQTKALETLRQFPLNSALAAARALEASVKLERLIRGEPNDRTELSTEQVIRSQMDRWLTRSELPMEGNKGGNDGSDDEARQAGSVS